MLHDSYIFIVVVDVGLFVASVCEIHTFKNRIKNYKFDYAVKNKLNTITDGDEACSIPGKRQKRIEKH